MNIVIQDLSDNITRGLSIAFHVSGLNTILWNPDKKSIFDVFAEMDGPLLIVHSSYYKDHSEEFSAAQLKYGGLIFVLGMEFDDNYVFGRCMSPTANIVDSIARIDDKLFKSDIAMIVDVLRPNDEVYINQIIDTANDVGLSLRIYGSHKLDTPYYVGKIDKGAIWKVYNNAKVHIDLYGEHYLGPFLYDKLSICELQYRDFDDTWLNCDTLDGLKNRLLEVKQEKISTSILRKMVLEQHTNFDGAAFVLGTCGQTDLSLKVLEKKREIINEFWSGC